LMAASTALWWRGKARSASCHLTTHLSARLSTTNWTGALISQKSLVRAYCDLSIASLPSNACAKTKFHAGCARIVYLARRTMWPSRRSGADDPLATSASAGLIAGTNRNRIFPQRRKKTTRRCGKGRLRRDASGQPRHCERLAEQAAGGRGTRHASRDACQTAH
jgi:hypothetical protein